MATVKDALNAIESHEKECKALYTSIEKSTVNKKGKQHSKQPKKIARKTRRYR